MQPMAYATILVASAFLLEVSSIAEASYDLQDSLAELLLANTPRSALNVQPGLSRHVSPTMIRATRRAPAVPRPRSQKLETFDVILEATRRSLEDAEVIFAIKSEGLTVNQRDSLKSNLPEDVLASVVKNTLMSKALEDSAFKPAQPLAKGCNMWFFLKFEDLRKTWESVEAWQKEHSLAQEEYGVLGGAMDGEVYDAAGMKTLSKLPTKTELIAKVAFLINQIPTKLAKGIKEVPTKVARGVKAVSEKEEVSA